MVIVDFLVIPGEVKHLEHPKGEYSEPPLFDTLIPAFSRRAKEILTGLLNTYD